MAADPLKHAPSEHFGPQEKLMSKTAKDKAAEKKPSKKKLSNDFTACCKTRLEPNKEQRAALINHAGAARFAYNWGLSIRKLAYAANKTSLTAIDLHKILNSLKPTVYPWLYEVSKCAPQEALRDLDTAYKNFWRRLAEGKRGKKAGFPHYKSRVKHGIGGFRLTGTIRVLEGGYVQLPRIGKIKLSEKDYLPLGDYPQAMIRECAGNWFVSIKCVPQHRLGIPKARGRKKKIGGLDLGIKSFITMDNGRQVDAPKPSSKALRSLRKLEKEKSRRTLGSANRQKTGRKLARLHAHVANQRSDFLHKLTTELVKTYSVLGIESLNVAGMMLNKHLSRAVADVGMGEFLRQLEYKGQWYACQIIAADQWYPSTQICSACHNRREGEEKLTLKDRTYHCHECGLVLDRDINAARNLAQLVAKESKQSKPSKKQHSEPSPRVIQGRSKTPVENPALALSQGDVKLGSLKQEPSLLLA